MVSWQSTGTLLCRTWQEHDERQTWRHPKTPSTSGPRLYNARQFSPRWSSPACRNVHVRSLQCHAHYAASRRILYGNAAHSAWRHKYSIIQLAAHSGKYKTLPQGTRCGGGQKTLQNKEAHTGRAGADWSGCCQWNTHRVNTVVTYL